MPATAAPASAAPPGAPGPAAPAHPGVAPSPMPPVIDLTPEELEAAQAIAARGAREREAQSNIPDVAPHAVFVGPRLRGAPASLQRQLLWVAHEARDPAVVAASVAALRELATRPRGGVDWPVDQKPLLFALLTSASAVVSTATVWEAWSFLRGDAALDGLLARLGTDHVDAVVRQVACETLWRRSAEFGDHAAPMAEALARAAGDEVSAVAQVALAATRSENVSIDAAPESLFDALVAAATSDDPQRRSEALAPLGRFVMQRRDIDEAQTTRAREVLAAALRDPSPTVRIAAVRAVGEFGAWPASADAVVALFDDDARYSARWERTRLALDGTRVTFVPEVPDGIPVSLAAIHAMNEWRSGGRPASYRPAAADLARDLREWWAASREAILAAPPAPRPIDHQGPFGTIGGRPRH